MPRTRTRAVRDAAANQPTTQTRPPTNRCAWCSTPLTRSRGVFGVPLYEVYTICGAVVSVCFEACPTIRRRR